MLLLDLARCRGTRLLNCSNEKADLLKTLYALHTKLTIKGITLSRLLTQSANPSYAFAERLSARNRIEAN